MTRPLIVYIPGLLPKPDAATHHAALFRCLKHGLQTADAERAAQLGDGTDSFALVPWTWGFYREHRDFALDAPSVDAMLQFTSAPVSDVREARSLANRVDRMLRRVLNPFPSVGRFLADERARIHIADLGRYRSNVDGAASIVRSLLRDVLVSAFDAGRPTLLLAHSLGSVIAWDTLWDLSRIEHHPYRLDTLFTLGSPLGQRMVLQATHGYGLPAPECYPDNIDRWWNASAEGDKTAAIEKLAPVFSGMHAMLEEQQDMIIQNWFRLDGELNTHAEYGYLANPEVARKVADWLRRVS
ncbi:MAG: hypothetical protein AAGF72_09905 [Pseudomonadota bacterium]